VAQSIFQLYYFFMLSGLHRLEYTIECKQCVLFEKPWPRHQILFHKHASTTLPKEG